MRIYTKKQQDALKEMQKIAQRIAQYANDMRAPEWFSFDAESDRLYTLGEENDIFFYCGDDGVSVEDGIWYYRYPTEDAYWEEQEREHAEYLASLGW